MRKFWQYSLSLSIFISVYLHLSRSRSLTLSPSLSVSLHPLFLGILCGVAIRSCILVRDIYRPRQQSPQRLAAGVGLRLARHVASASAPETSPRCRQQLQFVFLLQES